MLNLQDTGPTSLQLYLSLTDATKYQVKSSKSQTQFRSSKNLTFLFLFEKSQYLQK